MENFWKVLVNIKEAALKANIKIVTGDTKVVEKGKGDQIFINTSGIGLIHPKANIHHNNINEGDVIIVSGNIASHGIAIMSLRKGLEFETTIESGEFEQKKIEFNLKGKANNPISILNFFNNYTEFRNKIAHPLKNNRAIFPINDENYYLYFTPLLEQSYSLIVTHFQELWSYKNFIITSKTEDELHLSSEDDEPIHISLPLVTEFEVNQKVFYKIDEDLFLSDWKKLIVPNQKAIQEINYIIKI